MRDLATYVGAFALHPHGIFPARTRAAYNGWISPAENTDPAYLYSTQQEMILAEVCYPRSVQELYVFLKSTYLHRAIRFKECRLCDKLFAATDGNRTEYCSREYEKGGARAFTQDHI